MYRKPFRKLIANLFSGLIHEVFGEQLAHDTVNNLTDNKRKASC